MQSYITYKQKDLKNKMKPEIIIIDRLPVERWSEVKALRIMAMKSDPQAFSSDMSKILEQKDEEWQEMLRKNLNGGDITIFAEIEGRLIGMGRVIFYTKERFKHNIELQALFVDPEFRGHGIGELLLKKRVELVSKIDNIKNVLCTIYGSQVASIEVHKKHGFEIVGRTIDFVNLNGEYFDMLHLQKILK